jgi:hypothetical protein
MKTRAYRAEIMSKINDINTADMSWTMSLILLDNGMRWVEDLGNYTIGFWHQWFDKNTFNTYLDGVYVWVETDLDGVTKVPSIEFKYMWTHTAAGGVNITFYMWLHGTKWSEFDATPSTVIWHLQT